MCTKCLCERQTVEGRDGEGEKGVQDVTMGIYYLMQVWH